MQVSITSKQNNVFLNNFVLFFGKFSILIFYLSSSFKSFESSFREKKKLRACHTYTIRRKEDILFLLHV